MARAIGYLLIVITLMLFASEFDAIQKWVASPGPRGSQDAIESIHETGPGRGTEPVSPEAIKLTASAGECERDAMRKVLEVERRVIDSDDLSRIAAECSVRRANEEVRLEQLKVLEE